MKEKLLRIFLSIVMVLTLIPAAAFAQEGPEESEDPGEPTPPPAIEIGLSNFQKVQTYEDGHFTDVPSTQWYADSVKGAYEYALIAGTTATTFAPDMQLTVAQAITLAARIHSIYVADGHEFEADPACWYKPYVDYAISEGIITSGDFPSYDPVTNRQQFAYIMSRTLPKEEFEAINEIPEGTIPDVKTSSYFHDMFYLFYRAGILTGADEIYSADPLRPIPRREVAAILIRIVEPSARIKFETKSTITIYAGDGTTKEIIPVELSDYEAQGWSRYPITTVYCWNGQKKNILTSQVDAFLKGNLEWAKEPFSEIPSSIKSQKKTQTAMPVVYVNTGGKEVLSKTTYVPCTVSIYNAPKSQSLNAQPGGIRVRGNASSYYGNTSKMRANPIPYRLKFDDKVSMLGLNNGAKCKSWVLYTNLDNEQDVIKNDIAFRMGRMLMNSDGYWCSDQRLCHLYLNGKFWGTYGLCEQNQANKNRVNVAEPDEGVTAANVGYFLEMDNYYETPYFKMDYEGASVRDANDVSRKFRSNGYSIKTDTWSQEQKDFIAKYTRGVFKIVYQACEKGNYLTFDSNYNVVPSSYKSAEECVNAVLDVRSAVDMYILYEIMCDFDCGESSFYMCVDFSDKSKFKKLTFTAPWDFNWTCQGTASNKLFASVFRDSSFISRFGDRSNPWFIILWKQPWFQKQVKQKWAEIGGISAISQCVNEERSIIALYKPDIDRRTSGKTGSALTNLNWIEKRAGLLGSARWS